MTERDFKVGDIVTIRGRGEAILEEDCRVNTEQSSEETVWRCSGHGPPNNYWVRQKEIVAKATRDLLLSRHKEATARNVGCISPDCWCRRYIP
jgi:hypothetical protein